LFTFFAGGSALLVWPINKLGRLPDQPALVRGHPTPLTAFALSPVQQHLLATGASDGVVRLEFIVPICMNRAHMVIFAIFSDQIVECSGGRRIQGFD
jgi:hypothetical protein